jgi:neutral ceramidase
MQAGRDMPDVAPIGLVRLGGLALAFVPAEVTTVAGVRMANHLKRHLAGTDHVALIGLTNEYVEYVATAEEFKAQHYEGASTIYGPATAKLLENHLVCLADHLSHVAAKCLPQRFEIDRLGVTRVEPQVPSTSRMPPDVEDCTQDFNALITPEKHHENGVRGWRISWQGEPPGYARTPHRLWIEVQRQLPQGWTKLDDDSGSNMEVTYEYDEHRDAHMWHAEWRPLAVRGEQCMDYRFVVHARSTHTSTAFTFCGRLVEIDRSSEAP